MIVIAANRTANHAISIAHAHHGRTDQRQTTTHFDACHFFGHAMAAHFFPIHRPVLIETLIKLWVSDFNIFTKPQTQSKLRNTILQHGGTAHKNWLRKLFVDDDLHGTQDTLVLAFRKHNPRASAFTDTRFSGGKQRPHKSARAIHELLELLDICIEIRNRTGRDTALHGRFCHGRRDTYD